DQIVPVSAVIGDAVHVAVHPADLSVTEESHHRAFGDVRERADDRVGAVVADDGELVAGPAWRGKATREGIQRTPDVDRAGDGDAGLGRGKAGLQRAPGSQG